MMVRKKIKTHIRRETRRFDRNDKSHQLVCAKASYIWIYGRHAVQAALNNPDRGVESLLATKNATNDLSIPTGIMQTIASPNDLESVVPRDAVHQGCAVKVKPLEACHINDLAPNEKVPAPLVIVLDQVTDPHNVGAVARSAAAFGVSAIILPDRKAAPESGAMAKTACGGLEFVPIIRTVNLVQTLGQLKAMGYWTLGFDSNSVQTLEYVADNLYDTPTVIVVGSEGYGLRHLTREHCDHVARIPMTPFMESLNVSNATAIALYALSIRKLSG